MKPRVFIGSSAEGIAFCKAVLTGLDHTVYATGWYDIFNPSSLTLDALEKSFETFDFGVFIMSPDDGLDMRDKRHVIGRDNVLFEAGLFMGMHGRQRTFVLAPRGVPNFHMPTDLVAFTTVDYDHVRAKTGETGAFGAAISNIEKAIREVPKHGKAVKIHPQVTYDKPATWPLKLWMEITNPHGVAVTLSSRSFHFDGIKHSSKHSVLGPTEPHIPIFETGKTDDGKDIHNTEFMLKPGESVKAWVALDETFVHDDAKALLVANKLGVWEYFAVWNDAPRPHVVPVKHTF